MRRRESDPIEDQDLEESQRRADQARSDAEYETRIVPVIMERTTYPLRGGRRLPARQPFCPDVQARQWEEVWEDGWEDLLQRDAFLDATERLDNQDGL